MKLVKKCGALFPIAALALGYANSFALPSLQCNEGRDLNKHNPLIEIGFVNEAGGKVILPNLKIQRGIEKLTLVGGEVKGNDIILEVGGYVHFCSEGTGSVTPQVSIQTKAGNKVLDEKIYNCRMTCAFLEVANEAVKLFRSAAKEKGTLDYSLLRTSVELQTEWFDFDSSQDITLADKLERENMERNAKYFSPKKQREEERKVSEKKEADPMPLFLAGVEGRAAKFSEEQGSNK